MCPTHFFALLCLAAVAARGPKSIRVDDQILQKTYALKCWGEDSQWVESSSCHFDCSLNAIVNGSVPPNTGSRTLQKRAYSTRLLWSVACHCRWSGGR